MAEDVELIDLTMTAEDIAALKQMLVRIEGKLDRALDLHERMADATEPEPAPDVTDDDFAPCNLIELPLAAQRFAIAKDKLRRWCRSDGLGVLRGGRWMVSIPRLRRHLGQ